MGKTVIFRTLEENDANNLYQWFNDDDLKQVSVGLNRRFSHEEIDDWINARKNHNPYQYFWAICPKDQPEKIIGYAYISDIHFINSSACFGGIVIGDKDYNDGLAWIETYLFVYEFVFERLGLNRLYGSALLEQKQTQIMRRAMFGTTEGVLRQAYYKNGKFQDASIGAILKDEYFEHKNNGDYEVSAIIKRIIKLKKQFID